MFTTTRVKVVEPDGKRDTFYGDTLALRTMIDAIYWLHLNNYHNRWYALVTFSDGKWGYIRCSFENFWSEDNMLRFYVGASPRELIQYAMKEHAYKSFQRRITAASASS